MFVFCFLLLWSGGGGEGDGGGWYKRAVGMDAAMRSKHGTSCTGAEHTISGHPWPKGDARLTYVRHTDCGAAGNFGKLCTSKYVMKPKPTRAVRVNRNRYAVLQCLGASARAGEIDCPTPDVFSDDGSRVGGVTLEASTTEARRVCGVVLLYI